MYVCMYVYNSSRVSLHPAWLKLGLSLEKLQSLLSDWYLILPYLTLLQITYSMLSYSRISVYRS